MKKQFNLNKWIEDGDILIKKHPNIKDAEQIILAFRKNNNAEYDYMLSLVRGAFGLYDEKGWEVWDFCQYVDPISMSPEEINEKVIKLVKENEYYLVTNIKKEHRHEYEHQGDVC